MLVTSDAACIWATRIAAIAVICHCKLTSKEVHTKDASLIAGTFQSPRGWYLLLKYTPLDTMCVCVNGVHVSPRHSYQMYVLCTEPGGSCPPLQRAPCFCSLIQRVTYLHPSTAPAPNREYSECLSCLSLVPRPHPLP